uniref:ORF83 n=1 Tax=Acanthamoeba castellanii TaxID=5755 RepID=Q33664_ACACA|nr:ORF83 [Acanthamoeba castellanii]AAD11832.1 ORF83 [Acanthamoeba castellanii]AOS85731.1 ORF83 [Acanthamoeba castellanii]
MFKFVRDFFENKQSFNIKTFAIWLNSSIKNRAIFVYSMATFSILVRYVYIPFTTIIGYLILLRFTRHFFPTVVLQFAYSFLVF